MSLLQAKIFQEEPRCRSYGNGSVAKVLHTAPSPGAGEERGVESKALYRQLGLGPQLGDISQLRAHRLRQSLTFNVVSAATVAHRSGALKGAVDGGAADGEDFHEVGDGVFAGGVHGL